MKNFQKIQNEIGWGRYTPEMIDQYLAELRSWLLERVNSEDCGWPEVSKEDWSETWQFVSLMLDLKFELDCDQDQVIKFYLTDRSKASQVALSIPHEASFSELSRSVEILNSYASNYSKILSFRLRDKENADAAAESKAA